MRNIKIVGCIKCKREVKNLGLAAHLRCCDGIVKKCFNCNKIITIIGNKNSKRVFCNKECSKPFRKKPVRGPISQLHKDAISKANTGKKPWTFGKTKQTDKRIESYGSKISKKLSKPFLIKKCKNCNNEYLTKSNKRLYCTSVCFNLFRRKTLCDIKKYRAECCFTFNVFNYPNEFDLELIKKHGMYKASNRGNNLNGISRDHIISINYGYKNKIDPRIIKHPANCQLLRHSKNISKGKKCTISMDRLLEKIKLWNFKYGAVAQLGEHPACNRKVEGS